MARPKRKRPSASDLDRTRTPKAQQQPIQAPTGRHWLRYLGGTALLAGIVAIALTASSPAGSDEPVVRDPAVVAAGAQLYATSCAACHGVDLRGTDTGPPFLNVIYAPNHHADEAFQRAVAGGVTPHHWNFGPMAAIDGLTRPEVATIVQFIRSGQEAAGIFRDPSH